MNVDITLASLFTAPGIVVGAAIVRQLVTILRLAIPTLADQVSGMLQAFIISALLYVWAFVAAGIQTPEGAFTAFMAWVSCASAAVGINSTLNHFAEIRAKRTAK